MEFLATFGMTAKNMFDYNRENFQFDQEQRLSRELLRQILQLKRFTLFREDIRDLVELTVGKMEMYHLVAALFMESSMALYFEGRIHHASPPFLLSLLYISIASAFMYLLLAVWLSMHASICSHSFGVRLLTRFVRLPVPGLEQMGAMNARLADFEKQGVKGMLRVPVVGGRQDWVQRQPQLPALREEPSGTPDLLGEGIKAWNKDDNILGSAQAGTLSKHVDLYRRLQCKWQCFDAYARVCMALGANQLILGLQYYLVITTLIQYRCPSVCFTLLTSFCCGGLALAYLDLAGLGGAKICLLQLMGSLPVWIAAISIVSAKKTEEGIPLSDNAYPVSPLAFFLNLLWFEGLLRVAWPSDDEATLPRLFRSVIFLDVFEDMGLDDEANIDQQQIRRQGSMASVGESLRPEPLQKEEVKSADKALFAAHWALRRWEALPETLPGFTADMKLQRSRIRHKYDLWHETFLGELSKRSKAGSETAVLQDDPRPWHALDEDEKEEDPFSGSLLGPFTVDSRPVYYNLEAGEIERGSHRNVEVLALSEVQSIVEAAEAKVRRLLGTAAAARGSSSSETDSESSDGVQRGRSFMLGTTGGKWIPQMDSTQRLQRLPWKVLYGCTRGLQVGWFIMFSVSLLEEFGLFQLNVQVMDEKEKEESEEKSELEKLLVEEINDGIAISEPTHHRRLTGSIWEFRRWPIRWPQPAFFRPEVVHCRPGRDIPKLIVGTAYQLYQVVSNSSRPTLDLEAVSGLNASAALLCENSDVGCLQASLAPGGRFLQLTRHADGNNLRVDLEISGTAWRKVAGIQVPCASLGSLLASLPAAGPAGPAGRCLLLAAWDGQKLPVSVVPESENTWPAQVAPIFDAPLKLPSAKARRLSSPAGEVLSLSLEQSEGNLRLWALLPGELWGWDLLSARVLGRWPVPGFSRGFEPTAICAGAFRRQLLLAGRSFPAGGQPGPELLAADLPRL